MSNPHARLQQADVLVRNCVFVLLLCLPATSLRIFQYYNLAETELAQADTYETVYAYSRIEALLASGGKAWVYLHTV